MSEPMYRIEDVRDQVLHSIRAHGPALDQALADRLAIPLYAVQAGLDAAQVGQLAAPTADGVWRISTPQQQAA